MNVLITAASTAQAYKLEKSISNTDTIILADSEELPAIMMKTRRVIKIPKETSASYAHQLLTICLDHEIKQIFPLRKLEIQALSEATQLFDEYGINVMVPERTILANFFGPAKTGELIIKAYAEGEPCRGAFLFNKGANPELQILTVD